MIGVKGREKKKHCFTLIHYCEHCHTDIVGVWEFYGVISPVSQPNEYEEDYIRLGFQTGNFFETESDVREYINIFYHSFDGLSNPDKDKIKHSEKILLPIVNVHKDIKKYREEYDRFAEMKKCPLCGSNFSDNFKYHLGTLYQKMDRMGMYSEKNTDIHIISKRMKNLFVKKKLGKCTSFLQRKIICIWEKLTPE